MIEVMTDMPEGTLGFRIAGNVTRDDLAKVVVPTLRGAIERDQPLRVLCQIDVGFSEEPGAVWEGVKADIELGIAHRTAWRRTAYVTDLTWIGTSVHLLSWLIPGEVRVFPLRELDAAKAWISE
jgi:stage II sporulation SpoAA-like protein